MDWSVARPEPVVLLFVPISPELALDPLPALGLLVQAERPNEATKARQSANFKLFVQA